MSKILGTIRAVSVIAIVGVAIVALPSDAEARPAVASTYIDPRPAIVEELDARLFANEKAFDEAVETELARLEGDTGKAKTETIDKLKADATAVIEEAQEGPLYPLFDQFRLKTADLPALWDDEDIEEFTEERRAEIDAVLTEARAPLTAAVDAWAAEVAAENERIRIAEEEAARKAAAEEAARQAAANRSNRGGGSSGGSASVAVPGESTEARIARLMNRLGMNVPYVIGAGGCAGIANLLGCYQPGDNHIFITERALRDDCTIMRVITHESRHMYQHRNGLIQYGNGGITNAAWLEQDAGAHTYCF